ncbi:hypothetical protein ACFCWD_35175 [Streptomyces sp. NPDC056374]|uniref:hypothetical protein n=1 Tax=unclassified Streptomyces TaxID=2593676 RepID=UPI0035DBC971
MTSPPGGAGTGAGQGAGSGSAPVPVPGSGPLPVPGARLRPGPAATAADLRRAEFLAEQLGPNGELRRVRVAATAWRNGLAGLLLALTGFTLITGRSDVGQLARPAGIAAGLLLAASLTAGGAGAWLLLRAAHGVPRVLPATGPVDPVALDHQEALDALRDLRAGRLLVLLHTVLLAAAVATTWYGPAREDPVLRIRTDTQSVCGTPGAVRGDVLELKTPEGPLAVDLSRVTQLAAAASCPPAP